MFVLVGYTRGDELERSRTIVLGADTDRAVVERHAKSMQAARDSWLAGNMITPPWAIAGVYSRFEVLEVATLSREPVRSGGRVKA